MRDEKNPSCVSMLFVSRKPDVKIYSGIEKQKGLCHMYKLIASEGMAKRGDFTTCHGTVKTPVFMNVATVAAIKGALSAEDLENVKCQVALSNTYHLHVRPGDELIKKLGGLHKFMSWERPLLTDSGGFQVFSLASLRKIKEEGVYFASHIDGRKIFMGPEESMCIQSNLGSTIAMAFDECVPYPSTKEYMQNSVDRTTRWLLRCIKKMDELNLHENTINKNQMLFGINQGGTFDDIRIEHAKIISELDLPGYSIGGLAVGETHEQMYSVLEAVVPYLPKNKPTYLMGVGTPENILESVERGIDFFDCVLPARNGRHANVYTNFGKLNLLNKKYMLDDTPIDEGCLCPTCRRHTKAYIRHLFKAKEMLAMRLCVTHNLFFFNTMMEEIREAIEAGMFKEYKKDKLEGFKRCDM
ncbi:queuine trna-ribosyltransferase [Holotrichia oblita]|nr:queuine trna-ribosyltransferase [Holotrichia oblita]